jgi:hypothetical protein
MASPASQAPKKQNPWASIAAGIAVASLGFFFFHFCDGLEKGTRDPRSVPLIFARLYQLGGKWFAAGVIMFLGGVAVWAGVRDLIKRRSLQEDPPSASLE